MGKQGQVMREHGTIHIRYYPDWKITSAKEREGMTKIHALFLAANPGSTRRLAIDEEMRAIEQKVRASEHRDALVFQSAWAVRSDDLLQLLNQHRPHVVHFSGHGSSEGLSLAGHDGQGRLVTTRALQALFTTLKDNIRLVLLNACYSSEQALALVQVIDCVIGMKRSIRDDAALTFASSFYRAIGFGRSIQEAFDQGITALLLEGIPDEDIPELLVRDGVDPTQIRLIGQPASPSDMPGGTSIDQQAQAWNASFLSNSIFTGREEVVVVPTRRAKNAHPGGDGYFVELLAEALLHGYPSALDLKLLVSFELHENIEIIASGGSLAEKVHSLVMWAISRGRENALIEGALKRNPGNPKLREFAMRYGF